MSVSMSAMHGIVRRMLRDYGAGVDTLGASCTANSTTLSVGNVNNFKVGGTIVIDDEALYVSATSGTTTLTVVRGYKGSTGTAHNSGSQITINPEFAPGEIIDGLNEGLRNLWPYFFQIVEDQSGTITDSTQSNYSLPASLASQDAHVLRVDVLEPGASQDAWYLWRKWEIRRSAAGTASVTGTLHFIALPPVVGSTYRVTGITPYSQTMDYTGSSDFQNLPDRAQYLVPQYAAYYLLMGREAQRGAYSPARNIGPMGQPPGATMSQAEQFLAKFERGKREYAASWPKFYTGRGF